MNSTGYLDEHGHYHKGEAMSHNVTTASTHREWRHDKQRREHAKDLIQPHLPNGQLNPEFRLEYPEEAKQYVAPN